MKKKILVIIYNIERAREHEWFVELLDSDIFEIEFVLIKKPDSFMAGFLRDHNIKIHLINYSGKKDLISLVFNLYTIMVRNKYNIVHAHLFEATLAGMIAAFFARVKNRIVTRHYSDYHHVYFPSVVKYDRLINMLSTKILAVSKNVMNILISKEGVNPSKVILVHHGIDLSEFNPANISNERIQLLKSKYNIPSDRPVIGVISRFIYWKGLQFILPAFSKILECFPGSVLILANAQGPYKQEVLKILESLPPDSFRLIEFETDVAALLRTFTCFVHTPVSSTAEAFGQTYIESIAAGIPGVFTLSGVAAEFAQTELNCIVVPFCDSEAIFSATKQVLTNNILSEELISNGSEYVKQHFDMKTKYEKISKLYLSLPD